MKLLALFLLILTLMGCSNKGVYTGIQTSNRINCDELPPSQYDECMANNRQSHEDYERERKQVVSQ